MPKVRKIQTGVSFSPAVMSYIDELRESEDPLFRRRTRSDVINLIIEEHAKRTGTPLLGESSYQQLARRDAI